MTGTKAAKPPKGIQVVRGLKFDFDAIRRTADAYSLAAAYYDDLLNGSNLATREAVQYAKSSAFMCCCDAQNSASKINVK